MSSDEVIELSIEETQALRAKLGLAPLRGVGGNPKTPSKMSSADEDGASSSADNTKIEIKEISLSIGETNALRLKIGLPPLKQSACMYNNDDVKLSKKEKEQGENAAVHAPPANTAAEAEARRRIEDAKAKRDVRERLQRLEEENRRNDDGSENESALNFATRMMMTMQGNNTITTATNNNNNDRKKKKMNSINHAQLISIPTEDNEEEQSDKISKEYTSADLTGIKVSHAASDFTAGSTTILTLADKSILDIDPNSKKVRGFDADADEHELINVNMDADSKALDNLRRKRQIELGTGRAGGYAGYDDDEFEELGGVGVVSSSLAFAAPAAGRRTGGGGGGAKSRGFAIGADGLTTSSTDDKKSDLFSTFLGGAVSLESRYGNTIASDFMSHNEIESKEDRLEKERAKQVKMLEKMRKKDKKKKKKKRRVHSDNDDESEEEVVMGGGVMSNIVGGSDLMASLEATAVDVKSDGNGRKRRRTEDFIMDNNQLSDVETDEITAKKKKFDQIMLKGKDRTDKAFQKSSPFSKYSGVVMVEDTAEDNADDDAFLNAALAKACRLKRLKEMNCGTASKSTKGEAVVVNAVEKIKQEEEASANSKDYEAGATKSTSGGLTFEFDEMQEFTRALRAREDQAKRVAPVRSRGIHATASTNKKEVVVKKEVLDDVPEPLVEDVDMEEMAQEMKGDDDNNFDDDDNLAAFGSTAENTGVGRGMSGFLSLLRQTGEIKNAGKEEMRGRAKDKRTYEDYDSLDLKKVVKIDTRNAQEKDIEFANREIKLEYRDDHGRLLTRKEAYRNMCYQFHGHGSSKKNEERRQKQIEREREENKLASRQVMAEGGVGTLGALKATQKATGKAFIVHKI